MNFGNKFLKNPIENLAKHGFDPINSIKLLLVRYLVSSLVLKLFPAQVNLLGLGGAFICNSMCCFLASGFVLRLASCKLER